MHIGLITFGVPGHLNPMTSLGASLQDRGHRVTVIGGNTARTFAERRKIGHAPIGIASGVDQAMDDGWRVLGKLSGIASMQQTGKLMAMTSRVLLDEAPDVLKELQVDALLVDQLAPAGMTVAAKLDLPAVIVCNALAAHYDKYCPPCPIGWNYRRDVVGRIRNAIAWGVIVPVYNRFADVASTGVQPTQLVFEFQHGLAQIAQQPAFFDFPRELPDHFHYTAPWHRAGRDDDVSFPWEWLDGRPLIYASMGTLQNDLPHVFQSIIDSIDGLDVQMVLTQGGSASNLSLYPPANVLLVKNAPQLKLLDKAALAITHAGLNTALECLTHGVPMVCVPVTNDQPGVAKRVEWLGLGEALPVSRVTAGRLRQRIELVLYNPRYRQTAAAHRETLSGLNGLTMATDVALQALETGKRIERNGDVATAGSAGYFKGVEGHD